MKSYKARGIVLNTLKYGEKGLIVHMLTDTGGRQSYMVQGVRTASRGSRMALMQPMFALEFEGFVSSRMSMHRMKDVHSGIVLQSIPFDVRKSTMALFMAETLYRLVKESEPNGSLFDFVWGSVAALDAVEEGVANFHLWFLANLSRPLGFSPDNDYSTGAWLDIRDGRFVGAAARVLDVARERLDTARHVGVRRKVLGRDRTQPHQARSLSRIDDSILRLPPRSHSGGRVDKGLAGGVLAAAGLCLSCGRGS